MKEIATYQNCFVCGDENKSGLKAKFYESENGAFTELSADNMFEGYAGIYHGGIIATVLDEVMVKAILARGIFALTAEMTIKYHHPVRIGNRLRFEGRIVNQRGRLILTEGTAADENGQIFATATGKYLQAKAELGEELRNSVQD